MNKEERRLSSLILTVVLIGLAGIHDTRVIRT